MQTVGLKKRNSLDWGTLEATGNDLVTVYGNVYYTKHLDTMTTEPDFYRYAPSTNTVTAYSSFYLFNTAINVTTLNNRIYLF